jgi:hypothetical protein
MKSIYPVLLLLALSSALQCQDPDSSKTKGNFYVGFGGGNGFGCKGLTGIHLTGFFSGHIGLSLNTHSLYIMARNQPADYEPGTFDRDFGKTDRIFMASLMLNYSIPAESRFRIGLECGPSVVKYQETKFTPNPDFNDGSYWLFPPKKYLTLKAGSVSSMGMSCRIKLEIPYCRYAGLELVTFASINGYHSFVGIELFLTFGRVNNRLAGIQRHYATQKTKVY